jgi:hypothetical protein
MQIKTVTPIIANEVFFNMDINKLKDNYFFRKVIVAIERKKNVETFS